MIISVIICTYRRPDFLKTALESLDRQDIPTGSDLEIIVVDNDYDRSAEDTYHAWASATVHKGVLVFEETLGLSHARNHGVDVARGEIVAFLDDDAMAHPDWAKGLLEAFNRTDVDAATGPVFPLYQNPPPAWLIHNERFFLTLLPQLPDGPLPRPFLPAGVNCAVRKLIFHDGHRFIAALGHKGKEIGAGEDSEFFRHLLKLGKKIWFSNAVTVYHHIPTERTLLDFYKRRLLIEGMASSQLDKKYSGSFVMLLIGLARVALSIFRDTPILIKTMLKIREYEKPLAICRLRKTLGYWMGMFVRMM